MNGADLAMTDASKEGVESGIVCILGLEFLCETKGGEVYFVQN